MQMLPNYFPTKYFKTIHSMICRFIWNNKRPRLKMVKLQLSVKEGGLGLPNIMYYHWASQIRYVAEWIKNDNDSTFLDLEAIGCRLSLSEIPFVNGATQLHEIRDNFIVRNTLKSLNQIRKHFGIATQYSVLAPVYCNPDFSQSCLDVGFRTWKDSGISKIQDLFQGDTLKSFAQLKTEYNLPQVQFFRYLQLRSYTSNPYHNIKEN